MEFNSAITDIVVSQQKNYITLFLIQILHNDVKALKLSWTPHSFFKFTLLYAFQTCCHFQCIYHILLNNWQKHDRNEQETCSLPKFYVSI